MPEIEAKFEFVEADDPMRCQHTFGCMQCFAKRTENSQYCPRHGRKVEDTKSLQLYRLAKYQQRLIEQSDHPRVKSLREEIGLLRIMLEEVWNQIKTPTDLILYSSKISDMISRIERLVMSCHKLEASTGALLDKTAVLQLAQIFVGIIGKYVTETGIIDAISNEIVSAVEDIKITKEIKMAAKRNFIAGAIKHPGALTAKAKAAGKTVQQFCAQGGHAGATAKQCNLAKTLRGMRKK